MCMSPLRTALCGLLLVWLETFSFMIVIKWGSPFAIFPFDVFECLETIQSRIHILPILQSKAHQSSNLPCHWCDLSNFPTRQEYGLPKGWEHDIDDEEELPVSPELVRCHSNMQDRICQPKKLPFRTILHRRHWRHWRLHHALTSEGSLRCWTHSLCSGARSPLRRAQWRCGVHDVKVILEGSIVYSL